MHVGVKEGQQGEGLVAGEAARGFCPDGNASLSFWRNTTLFRHHSKDAALLDTFKNLVL